MEVERKNFLNFNEIFKHTTRIFFLVLLVAAYSSSAEYVGYNYRKYGITQYFTITYLNNSSLFVFFPFYFFRFCFKMPKSEKVTQLTPRKLFFAVVLLNPLQYFSSYYWYFSLNLIPASVNITCYQVQNVIIFFFSIFFFWNEVKKQFLIKIIGISLSFVGKNLFFSETLGILLLSFGGYGSDSETYNQKTLGIITTIISATLYGFYMLLYSKIIGETTIVQTVLLISLFGIFNFFFFWILIIILNYTSIEPFFSEFNWNVFIFLVVNCILSGLYFLFVAILLSITSSPIYVGFSSLLSIVVTAIYDHYAVKINFSILTIFSFVLISLSIFVINVVEIIPQKYDFCLKYFSKNDKHKEERLTEIN